VGIISKATTLHVHDFCVHFFTVTARLRLEMSYFHVLWRTQAHDDEFFFFFLYLETVVKNRTPGDMAYNFQIWRDEIIAMKFKS